jgi:hypothetical protein
LGDNALSFIRHPAALWRNPESTTEALLIVG